MFWDRTLNRVLGESHLPLKLRFKSASSQWKQGQGDGATFGSVLFFHFFLLCALVHYIFIHSYIQQRISENLLYARHQESRGERDEHGSCSPGRVVCWARQILNDRSTIDYCI